ncbi:hypothetical protein AURDEDRAFT_170284, partial [Auricularia subglabra TFB-10046 SS5]
MRQTPPSALCLLRSRAHWPLFQRAASSPHPPHERDHHRTQAHVRAARRVAHPSSAEAASVPRTPSKPRMVSQSTATPSRTTPKRVISRVPPAPSRHPVSEVYPMYLDLVRDRSVLFVQLEPRSWAAQLYDFDKCERHRSVHGWTVVTAEFSLDGKASYSCSLCVDYKIHGTCVHVKVVEDVDAPDFLVMSETYGDEFIPLEGCGEEETGLPQWTFAMLSQDHQPVFVTHAGRSFSEGAWACSKHRNECHHVAIARQRCREAEAEHGLVNLDVDDEADAQEVDELLGSEKAHADDPKKAALPAEPSVSQRPIGPPRWCCMDGDEAPWFPLVDPVPDVLRLEGRGRCRCGAVPPESVQKRILPCVIYGSQRVYHRQVE